MANPKLFNTEGVGLTKQSDHFLRIAIGATGAPGAITLSSPAFSTTPLTRTGAGAYTCTLREPWAFLCGFSATTEQATFAAGDGLYGNLVSTANLATLGTFTFQMLNNSTAAADPRNPSILYIWLSLKNNALTP